LQFIKFDNEINEELYVSRKNRRKHGFDVEEASCSEQQTSLERKR